MPEETPENQTPQPAPTVGPSPARRHVRRGLVVAVAFAAAMGAGGFGVGLATQRSASTASTSVAVPQTQSPSGGYGESQGSQDWQQLQQAPTWPDQQSQQQSPQESPQGSTSSNGDTTSQASDEQLTGLVRIVSTLGYAGGTGVGTGMILSSDGEVVTNHHVVAGATKIEVQVMSTGKTYAATVVGSNAEDDVAVIDLQGASGLDTVKTDSDGVSVNEAVTAVGDGNGAAYLSAATGTVMATGQQITTEDEANVQGETLTGLIEISSDVVPGYSGGATYDADGEVVGMTTAASSGTSSDTTGYAVPIATVLQVARDLEAGVRSSAYTYGNPAFLGIGLGETGLTVQGVYEGTPAAKAGIDAGSTITRIDGTRITSAQQLRNAIAAHAVGDRVKITWTDSSGTTHVATVTLAKGPVA